MRAGVIVRDVLSSGMPDDPSLLEAALLGLLSRAPASGYQLRKIFQTTPLATYSDSPGAVYPALRRLRQRRFVSETQPEGGRRTTTYRVTTVGRDWLRRWVSQPVRAPEAARGLPSLDLRLALMSHIAPRRLSRFLRECAVAVQEYHDSVQRSAGALEAQLLPSGALALELGIHLLHARQAWYRGAVKRLAR